VTAKVVVTFHGKEVAAGGTNSDANLLSFVNAIHADIAAVLLLWSRFGHCSSQQTTSRCIDKPCHPGTLQQMANHS
jgi:hypothetical protein